MQGYVRDVIGRISVGEPRQVGELEVFPLFCSDPRQVEAVSLDEALSAGALEVKEVSQSGSVPTLQVTNSGGARVLLLAGEQLVGAKQNRILNTSVLLEANQAQQVPVSCVERGRWSYQSRAFASSGSASHNTLRRKLNRDVAHSYAANNEASSDQSEVWAEVDRKLLQLGSRSSTSALEQAYADHGARLERLIAGVSLPEDARGVAFAIGGRVVGLDLFDRPEQLRHSLSKLAKAAGLDALEDRTPTRLGAEGLELWLRNALEARCEVYPSPALGHDVRLSSPELLGSALVVEQAVVHLQLFMPEGLEERTIAVVPTDEDVSLAASEAIQALAAPFRRLNLHLALVKPREVLGRRPLSEAEERDLVAQARAARPEAGLRLALTRRALRDSWFSHRHEGERGAGPTVVVSTAGVATMTRRPLPVFVAYELIVHALGLLAPGLNPIDLLHEQTKGCLFDLCERRVELVAKLTQGKLCRPCAQRLSEGGVEPARVRELLQAMVAVG